MMKGKQWSEVKEIHLRMHIYNSLYHKESYTDKQQYTASHIPNTLGS